MSKGRLNMTGQKFGLLTVLHDAHIPKTIARGKRTHNRYVRCQCDCGNSTAVRIDHLRRGKTRSCGCLQQEIIFARQLEGITPERAISPTGAILKHCEELQVTSDALAMAAVAMAERTPDYDRPPSPSSVEARHGLPAGEYQRMLTAQGGVCKICGAPPGIEALHVDHDHATDKVRGLLCRKCNHGLGFFCDDILRLAKAMKYLSDSLQSNSLQK